MLFDSCTSSCGYVAILISSLCFGSYSVFMKTEAVKSVDIDPLVFQTYKTITYFIVSIILILGGQPMTFTPWGIVSGLLWIPAGVCHVLAVRNSGIAIASGISSSVTVMCSFLWGSCVFHERVRSVAATIAGIQFVVFGMIGMALFSSESGLSLIIKNVRKKNASNENSSTSSLKLLNRSNSEFTRKSNKVIIDMDDHEGSIIPLQTIEEGDIDVDVDIDKYSKEERKVKKYKGMVDSSSGSVVMIEQLSTFIKNKYGIIISPRNIGIFIALFGGMWGGSVMVPLHYAGSQSKGFNYVFSFAIGSTLVNLFAWVVRFYFLYLNSSRDANVAYRGLPSFHLRVMLIPGFASGAFYSLGNLASIISVTYLGEGLGYSMTQSSMLISGLWGIFYYNEITSSLSMKGWITSASIALAGMMILCLNHLPMTAPAILDMN